MTSAKTTESLRKVNGYYGSVSLTQYQDHGDKYPRLEHIGAYASITHNPNSVARCQTRQTAGPITGGNQYRVCAWLQSIAHVQSCCQMNEASAEEIKICICSTSLLGRTGRGNTVRPVILGKEVTRLPYSSALAAILTATDNKDADD